MKEELQIASAVYWRHCYKSKNELVTDASVTIEKIDNYVKEKMVKKKSFDDFLSKYRAEFEDEMDEFYEINSKIIVLEAIIKKQELELVDVSKFHSYLSKLNEDATNKFLEIRDKYEFHEELEDLNSLYIKATFARIYKLFSLEQEKINFN